ncbi:MAG TPA: hypothetical protein EYP85_03765, partial [Armatimonadetes bacterium]|nr:hypothetical protein [Armatimonadota bacterium]
MRRPSVLRFLLLLLTLCPAGAFLLAQVDEYRLAPGDQVEISIYGEGEPFVKRIGPDGCLATPLTGRTNGRGTLDASFTLP